MPFTLALAKLGLEGGEKQKEEKNESEGERERETTKMMMVQGGGSSGRAGAVGRVLKRDGAGGEINGAMSS